MKDLNKFIFLKPLVIVQPLPSPRKYKNYVPPDDIECFGPFRRKESGKGWYVASRNYDQDHNVLTLKSNQAKEQAAGANTSRRHIFQHHWARTQKGQSRVLDQMHSETNGKRVSDILSYWQFLEIRDRFFKMHELWSNALGTDWVQPARFLQNDSSWREPV